MRALAIIPARGGSKTIAHKNLETVAGRTLVGWAIRAGQEAMEHGVVDEVIVSTDDEGIRNVARTYGVTVVDRPAALATDQALTDPVLVHAVRARFPVALPPDHLTILLQPTVPFRRPGLVRACVRRLLDTEADSLLTAYTLHFVWWREWNGWRTQCPRRPRRQDMYPHEQMFHEDGAVYVTRTALLVATGQRLSGRVEVFENERSVDIDTPRDLDLARAMMPAPGKEAP